MEADNIVNAWAELEMRVGKARLRNDNGLASLTAWDEGRAIVEAAILAPYAALVKAAQALADRPHVIQIREDGWGIQHPLYCRPALTECLVHKAAGQWDGPPREPGQYFVDTFGNVGEPYNAPDPAIAFLHILYDIEHGNV